MSSLQSPSQSQSQPPPPPQPPSPNNIPDWRFPFGPSSVYRNERPAKIQHARFKSCTQGTAPVLSTEARAHRRRQTNRGSFSSPRAVLKPGQASPPPRSPLSRFASSKSCSSASPSAMAAAAARSNASLPQTPAKHARNSSSMHQQSPFSDYFTDEARSVDSASISVNAPWNDTKQLLVKMNKLQSQLMREQCHTSREAINIVGRKLGEIESELNALRTQSRQPSEIDDSGVFMEDDEDEAKSVAPHSRQASMQSSYAHGLDGAMDMPAQPETLEQYKAEREWFVLRMQDLVDGLTTAQSELSKRYVEVRELNERHSADVEEREMQLEQLRAENEGLRSDLGFEYSELLFLKLQMKSMECDVDAINEDSDFDSLQPWTQSTRREKKNSILSEMDRWRSDWQDVNSRFKRRRSKYGVKPDRRDSVSTSSVASSSGEADWHLETVKEVRGGRVASLTIRRTVSGSDYPVLEELCNEEAEEEAVIDSAHTEQSFSKDTPDLEGQTHKHGDSEPQIAEKRLFYTEHGTQTELKKSQDEEKEEDDQSEDEDVSDVPAELLQDSLPEDPEAEIEDGGEELEDAQDEDDCAIATSSEEDIHDVEEHDGVEFQEPTVTVRSKTAWQELWSSLQNLSGLGEEEDDE